MATFILEAEEFTLLTATAAQALALPSDAPTDIFAPYEIENRNVQSQPVTLIRILPTGNDGDKARATSTFDLGSGVYTVAVNYVDENDGNANGELIVGNNAPLTWVFDVNTSSATSEQEVFSDRLSIQNGDTIIFTGQRQGDEIARIDSFAFTEVVSGELAFTTASDSVNEAAGTVDVTVTRSNADVGVARATLVLGGTATDSSDYTVSSTEIVFAEGDLEETITITLVDDSDDETDETLTLSLGAIAGESVIGSQDIFTLNILDNDDPVVTPTPTPTPGTPSPTPGTPSPTPGTPSPTPGTPSLTPGTPSPTPGTPSPTPGTPSPTPETPGTPSPTPGTPSPTPETPGTPSPTPETPVPTPSDSPVEMLPTVVADEVINGPTQRADNLQGSNDVDVINALRGNDVVITGLGDDVVRGRRGRDFIATGAGDDEIRGGRHRDVINAGSGDDRVYGGRGGDTINGGTGNDILVGRRGRDQIFGNAGDDILDGGRARDQLSGGGGDDILDGGPGRDTLSGGAGRDTFVLSLQIGSDIITDFERGRDRIQLNDGLSFADLDIQTDGSVTRISTLDGKLLATLDDVISIADNAFV